MTHQQTRRLLPTAAFTLAMLFAASAALAQGGATVTGPFAGLAGEWTGSGTLRQATGAAERLRCQASYMLSPSGRTLHQDLSCASASYSFHLRTSAESDGTALSGTWTETTQNVQGRIAGTIAAGQVRATAQGPNFSASLAISTRGSRQSVNIRSSGTELRQVAIIMNRTR
jgi:hypothetical protein